MSNHNFVAPIVQPMPPRTTVKSKQKYQKCVGLLQALWITKLGHIEAVSYSTAFIISPSIIVTCSHAIFNTTLYSPCSRANFIPVNRISRKEDIYQTKLKSFVKYQAIDFQTNFGYKPLREDLAVLVLDKPYQTEYYFDLAD
jgi:hypothetical protein